MLTILSLFALEAFRSYVYLKLSHYQKSCEKQATRFLNYTIESPYRRFLSVRSEAAAYKSFAIVRNVPRYKHLYYIPYIWKD